MIVGPRYKICKRLGNSVFEKCQTQKFALSESRRNTRTSRSKKRPAALSDFGKQLLEKQRVRYTYGVSERQLARYIREAIGKKGAEPINILLTTLETRLDNTVFRIGLAPTRRAARQMVSHGHIAVDGKKVTIPSFHVKVGHKISIRDRSKDSTLFQTLREDGVETKLPSWLLFNNKKMEGEIKNIPTKDSVELPFDLSVVLEFYSR